ncbi:S-layer homology domain-containing protein [Bacillus infantis]|uniref:S-layer homology domain-containing protein n=1 Tax=Bacillus infantis TaxID=324767 RepID=UPI001CD3085E|nr:S-layer homology domain-containing protein [Bacillus infantis]MCA1033680.1 S-layer homology domain-containing protein [Bacillus infantis]
MKKYPFSNKTVKAILAATIAFSPVVTTGIFTASEKVEAAEVTSNEALNRMTLIYSKFSTEEKAVFNKAANGLNSFGAGDWTAVLTADVANKINGELRNLSEPALKSVKAEDIAKKLSMLVYGATSANLGIQLKDFKNSNEGKAFEEVVGPNSIDTILQFLVDAEKKLWEEDLSVLMEALRKGSIEGITAEIRDELLAVPAYQTLNANLASKMGTSLEGIFEIKDRINDKLVSNGAITPEELTTLRDAFLNAAFSAGRPSSPTPGGGIGGGGPVPTQPTNPGQNDVTLPADSSVIEKVTNSSGVTEVVTKVVPEKVQEIVAALTSEKSVVPITLESAGAGEDVKAEVPASLFAEALKKNSKAVVSVRTEEASYNLPVSEINVSALAKKLGVSESSLSLTVAVNVVDLSKVSGTVSKNSLKLASNVIEFSVQAVSGSKTETISVFGSYVERNIVGSKTFNAEKSVAVKLNDNGTFSAVPTLFDGKTATVKSLTNSKYTIVENDVTFPDVNNKSWAEEYIETLASKYIIKGKETGKYDPAEHMTRAQFAVLLVRALGLPGQAYDHTFKDVSGKEWFNKEGELMAAVKYGVIQGIGDGTFAPNEKITRAQAAAMIERAMNIKFLNYDKSQLDKSKKLSDFKDAKKVGGWAQKGVEAVYQAGIVSGKLDGNYDPNGYTQRDQMAKILANFLISANLMNDTINK